MTVLRHLYFHCLGNYPIFVAIYGWNSRYVMGLSCFNSNKTLPFYTLITKLKNTYYTHYSNCDPLYDELKLYTDLFSFTFSHFMFIINWFLKNIVIKFAEKENITFPISWFKDKYVPHKITLFVWLQLQSKLAVCSFGSLPSKVLK